MSRTAVHAFGSPFSKFSRGRFCPVQQSTDASIQPRPALYGGSGTLLACGHDGSESLSLTLYHILYMFDEFIILVIVTFCICLMSSFFSLYSHILFLMRSTYLDYKFFWTMSSFCTVSFIWAVSSIWTTWTVHILYLFDVRPRYIRTRTHAHTHTPKHIHLYTVHTNYLSLMIKCYVPHVVSTVGGGLRWGQDGRCVI